MSLYMQHGPSNYTRYRFVPRMLRNVDTRDLSVTVLGDRISFPVGLAPTAYQCMAHPDGELAAAKAANRAGAVYTLSTLSNTPLEDVAKACTGQSPLWMQVYFVKQRNVLKSMIQKAEDHGYRALVLTVDTPVDGLRVKIMKTGFSLLPHLRLPNIEEGLVTNHERISLKTIRQTVDPTISWDDVACIRSISRLPIILKGILTGEDARLAVQHGASAIWVSNHGGRQLDGTFASGEEGVTRVLEILRSELDRAMSLSGCRNIEDIGRSLVRNVPTSKI